MRARGGEVRSRAEATRGSAGDLSNLASGWLLNLLGIASTAIFGFAFGIVVARSLGAAGSGVFFVAVTLFMLLQAASEFGSGTGMVRTVARLTALRRYGDIRRLMTIALVPPLLLSTVLAAALFVFATQIADVVLAGEAVDTATPYLKTFAFFLPLAAASAIVLATTRGLGTMVPMVAIEQIGKSLARLVLTMAAVAAGAGAVVLGLAWGLPVAAGLLAGALALVSLLRRTGRAPTDAAVVPRRALAREFWRFTAPLGVAGVLQIALLWFDTILVAALTTPAEAGIYRAAARYVSQAMIANQAIVFVIGPLLSSLLALAYRERAERVYGTATMWIVAASWPINLTLAIFSPLLMRAYGGEFENGATALTILALSLLAGTAAGPVSVVLVMGGKSGWHLANIAAALGVNIVLNLLLTPRYGMTGAAIAWAAGIVVNNVAPLVQVWILLRLHPFARGLALVAPAAVFCFGGIGIATRVLFPAEIGVFLGFCIVATSVYIGFLWRHRAALRLDVFRDAARARRQRSRQAGTEIPQLDAAS